MSLTITLASARATTSRTTVFNVFQGDRPEQTFAAKALTPSERTYLRMYAKKAFFHEKGEVDYIVFPQGKRTAFLLGLGKRKEWSRLRLLLHLRRLVSLAQSQKVSSIALHLQGLLVDGMTEEEVVEVAAVQFLLAEYRFGKYQRTPSRRKGLSHVELIVENRTAAARALLRGKRIAAATNLSRDLSNTPGSDMTPTLLAQYARTLAKESGCTIKVLDRGGIEREKMGAILGVAKGSTEDPRFIIMEYHGGPKNDSPLVFVGKGVTFDSGGINLKPSDGLSDMHMDMSGGASVLCALSAIAQLKLPVNAIALVPAVENMVSGSGYRPGDILKSRSGITIEIGNTDAEGRVILADALDYAKQYRPQCVVDVATLTGAAMVALGLHRAAMFSPDEALAAELMGLGERTGDRLWRLPLGEEYEAEIKGSVAEISNVGRTRYGGAINGAMFLKRFAGTAPWAHLDIAPTMVSADGQFLAKGATGAGVQLLVALARRRAERIES